MTKARDALRIMATKVTPESAKILEPLIFDLDDRVAEMLEEEAFYKLSKEARDKLKLAAQGNRNLWKPELDTKYQQAKANRAKGMGVRASCDLAGITTDQWYRRQRIEQTGRDR